MQSYFIKQRREQKKKHLVPHQNRVASEKMSTSPRVVVEVAMKKYSRSRSQADHNDKESSDENRRTLDTDMDIEVMTRTFLDIYIYINVCTKFIYYWTKNKVNFWKAFEFCG